MQLNILFLHGMGGGANSPVPRTLKRVLPNMQFTKDGEPCSFQVICETYDYDPEVATQQIARLMETYQPSLVISESMGAIHALGIQGIPHIYISPALNYDRATTLAGPFIALGNSLGFHYRKQRGANRQQVRGDHELLAKFKPMIQSYKKAVLNSQHRDPSFAFFGKSDEFKWLGIVSIEEYERLFGKTYEVHDGGHVFGARNVRPKLIPKIVEMLGLERVRNQRQNNPSMNNNEKITNVILPNGRKTVKKGEFSTQEDLLSVEMPDSVTVIKEGAFWHCTHLESIKLSNNLKTIEESAFFQCEALKSITLPEGLERIGVAAFSKCFNLESITIPKSVGKIEDLTFDKCYGLKRVKMPSKIDISNNAFHDTNDVAFEYY